MSSIFIFAFQFLGRFRARAGAAPLKRTCRTPEPGAPNGFRALTSNFLVVLPSSAIARHGSITFAGLETNATRRQFVPGEDLLLAQVIDLPQRNPVSFGNLLLIDEHLTIWNSQRHRSRGCGFGCGVHRIRSCVWHRGSRDAFSRQYYCKSHQAKFAGLRPDLH